ncbi:uncharacterized protein LOC121416098 [Lytechinus variegatus]|uniref:uncharacterized protein LOC121416098 n=1 Tax=Lytechinus variegatus TaxID=7654 RepID=UPI001BB1C7A0|nr:uncharacterized protein LOC121416098 [Lytechinus variegatus]
MDTSSPDDPYETDLDEAYVRYFQQEDGSPVDPVGPSSPKRPRVTEEVQCIDPTDQPSTSGLQSSRGQRGSRRKRRGRGRGQSWIVGFQSDTSSSVPEGETTNTRGAKGRGKGRDESRGRGRGTRSRGGARGRGGAKGRGARGRGVTRSRSRGRGRGGAGGSAGVASRAEVEGDVERIQALREARKRKLKEDISRMSRDEIESLLYKTVQRRPGMLFDLMMQPPDDNIPSGENVPWCSCGRCIDMPTDAERLCCGRNPQDCTSQHAVFELIIDEAALLIQRAMWIDLYNLEDDPQEPGEENRAMRHAAYRSFVFWQHGRLGQGNRRVIPSCCVTKIRSLYPSLNGLYTGYLPGRFV